MNVFDPQTFREFLSEAIDCRHRAWGLERRYMVSESSLKKFEKLLANTLYRHHSSFDLTDEIIAMGFPLTAQAMRQRNSGLPADPKTQVAHLGEVMGAEFARAFLGFETTRTFPKWLNPNVDQSMKGVDILGLRSSSQPAEILIGEAKAGIRYYKSSIEEGYDHLVDLHNREASRMLRFMKEVLRLRGDREGLANVDRHMADGVSRHYLLLAVTQSAPQDPFEVITEHFRRTPLSNLVSVHIQIPNFKSRNAKGEYGEEETWLSKLFSL